jgi:hypothetical protein
MTLLAHQRYETKLTRMIREGAEKPERDMEKNNRHKGRAGRKDEWNNGNKKMEAVRNYRRNTMPKGDRNKPDSSFTVPGSLNSHKGRALPH